MRCAHSASAQASSWPLGTLRLSTVGSQTQRCTFVCLGGKLCGQDGRVGPPLGLLPSLELGLGAAVVVAHLVLTAIPSAC